MVAQERVRGAGRVDGRPQVRLRVPPRLPELHAVATLGDDAIEHRRGPLPSLDLADDRRVRQPESRHERIGLRGVARGLVRLEGADQRVEVVERGDTLATNGRVRRSTRDGESERDRAGMGDDDVEARRLRDHRGIARAAGPDRGEHPLAAVLLRRDGDRQHLAVEGIRGPRGDERSQRGEDRHDAALHVARPAPVHRAVPDLAAPRIGRPGGGIARRDDVDVPDEEEPPPARPGRCGRSRPAATSAASRRPGSRGPRRTPQDPSRCAPSPVRSRGTAAPSRPGRLPRIP